MMPAIHARYVREAFDKMFSRPGTTIIEKAAKHADAFHNNRFIKGQHSGPDPATGIEFINKAGSYVVKKLKSASLTLELMEKAGNTKPDTYTKLKNIYDKKIVEALYAEGRKDHALQDFFSHTNLFHLEPQLSVKEINNILLGKQPLPQNLFTCEFTFKRDIPEMLGWTALKNIPKVLMKRIIKIVEPVYKAPVKDMPVSHCIMNLDKPGTFEDEFLKLTRGYSGFERASELAVNATLSVFEQGVKTPLIESIGEPRTAKLFSTLRTWQPANHELLADSDRIGEDSFTPAIKEFITDSEKFQKARAITGRFGEFSDSIRKALADRQEYTSEFAIS